MMVVFVVVENADCRIKMKKLKSKTIRIRKIVYLCTRNMGV